MKNEPSDADESNAMLRDHPLTELIQVAALRRPSTDIIVTIEWRLGTCSADFKRKIDDATVTNIGPGRLPEQLVRWKYRWSDVHELQQLIEQAIWSLGGLFLERFAKPPHHGEVPYSDPSAGIRPSFCGLGSCYDFPHSGASSVGDTKNGDLVKEAALAGYWLGRFDVCYRMNAARFSKGDLEKARRKDSTLQGDGSRKGPFPGWKVREPFEGQSGEQWLRTASECQSSDDHALLMPYDVARRTINYEYFQKPAARVTWPPRESKLVNFYEYIAGDIWLKTLLWSAAEDIRLSEDEFRCFCEAYQNSLFSADSMEDFGVNVTDRMEGFVDGKFSEDCLSEGYKIDLTALAKKLAALPTLQKVALVAALEGFYKRAGSPGAG
jgi:hypothetical protein